MDENTGKKGTAEKGNEIPLVDSFDQGVDESQPPPMKDLPGASGAPGVRVIDETDQGYMERIIKRRAPGKRTKERRVISLEDPRHATTFVSMRIYMGINPDINKARFDNMVVPYTNELNLQSKVQAEIALRIKMDQSRYKRAKEALKPENKKLMMPSEIDQEEAVVQRLEKRPVYAYRHLVIVGYPDAAIANSINPDPRYETELRDICDVCQFDSRETVEKLNEGLVPLPARRYDDGPPKAVHRKWVIVE